MRLLALSLFLLAPLAAEENPWASHLPRWEKDDWWVVRVTREVATTPTSTATVKDAYHLLYLVLDANDSAYTLLVSSTNYWSFVLLVDRRTLQIRKVVPSRFTLDYPNERISVTTEKVIYELEGEPTLVVFPEYRVCDFLFLGFPGASGSAGKATTITEAEGKGAEPTIATGPLAQGAEAKDGALQVLHETSLDGHKLKLATTWRAGAPFFVSAEFENGFIKSKGKARLMLHGKNGREVLLAGTHGYYYASVTNRDRDLPVTRTGAVDLFAQALVEQAVKELKGGKEVADRPVDLPGESWFRRGDTMRIYWHLRYIARATSGGPPKEPKKQVTIPNFGYFFLRVQDVRAVGDEELVFLVTPGEDSTDYSYRTRYSYYGRGPEVAWNLLSGYGGYTFANGIDYWQPSVDKKRWEWKRVSIMRAQSPITYAQPAADSEQAKYTREPTWWVIALRRSDLSLRAMFGARLDGDLAPQPFDVRLASAPDAPVFLQQGSQFLRPVDWLLVGGWLAVNRPPEKGSLLQISQTNPGQYRAQFEAGTTIEQVQLKNDGFFEDLASLLAKKDAEAQKKKKKNDKKQAKTIITADDLAKLEKGKGNDAVEPLLRKLESESPSGKATVFRVGIGREIAAYLGYDWTYPFWKEAAIVNFQDSYMATLHVLVPTEHRKGT